MILLHGSLSSNVLHGKQAFSVLLPSDWQDDGRRVRQVDPPYRTLYLLHGYGGDETDWLTHTPLSHLAKSLGIAVVLPKTGSDFYPDPWPVYLGTELPAITRRSFPLSSRKEDTWIMGASMGGYGALACMASFPTFGRCVALSAAVDGPGLPSSSTLPPLPKDRVLLACGTDDALFPADEALAARLGARWHPSAGGHDWAYWSRALDDGLRWLTAGQD